MTVKQMTARRIMMTAAALLLGSALIMAVPTRAFAAKKTRWTKLMDKYREKRTRTV